MRIHYNILRRTHITDGHFTLYYARDVSDAFLREPGIEPLSMRATNHKYVSCQHGSTHNVSIVFMIAIFIVYGQHLTCEDFIWEKTLFFELAIFFADLVEYC